jgi:hypothetical protein
MVGGIYFVAFWSLYDQVLPLYGAHGLLPAAQYLERVRTVASFDQAPTLFWFGASDLALWGGSALGLGLSALVFLGAANAGIMAALWALYLSYVHVGQIFYGFGWESLLLETGFLSIFLCPLRSLDPLRADSPPPRIVIWLFRWLLFRLMFGAGLIKLRGDECWRNLTCLFYHYETQPLPSPLSAWWHQMPGAVQRAGALFNHLVELVVPFGLFGPRRLAAAAGALTILFQLFLIVSGNLSWLNWLTIAIAVSCFDDAILERAVGPSARARLEALAGAPLAWRAPWPAYALLVLVAVLSVEPTQNLFSDQQVMNGSFDSLRLVNTYGAFGSIGRTRNEIVLEGTEDTAPGPDTQWSEIDFKCKPGDPRRRPCFLAPYQLRLDWQIWFAAMSTPGRQPWLIRLIDKLLRGDRAVRGLLAPGPFMDRPPRFIRARLYRYEFSSEAGRWWKRSLLGEYLPPVSLDDPGLAEFLSTHGWDDDD